MGNLQPSYYEMLAAEGIRELERKHTMSQRAAAYGQRSGFWRRGLRVVGQALVSVGTRLERADQGDQTIIYGS